ncbi:hypothetical protein G1C96_0235 [Bifidobacterium sp. DSM 109958]|uniref:Uncharacterized protein n=1 Tax=Bifidobacterium moraviense TaxID=2675323 RepID=A0A7Y0F0B2_9BIFI|nr:hypothetical protein [Bifidobacterium sp. DSM 109958]NMM99657.1 hypothetical protein [Bifidobacterium sp. DSM 109958]
MLMDTSCEGIENGIEWRVTANDAFFCWTGRVRLPEGHPWRASDGWDIPARVHGGVTYGPDEDGWIGFDTLHAMDSVMDLVSRNPDGELDGIREMTGIPYAHARSWTFDEVVAETLRLARQTARAAKLQLQAA